MAQFEIRPKWCKAMNNHAFWNFVGRVPAQFWTDWQGKCSGITCKHKWPNWALKNKNVMSCNTLRAIEFFVILFLKGIFWLGHKVSFEHSFIHTADNVRFLALALKIYCLYNILFLTQQITERNHCSLKKKGCQATSANAMSCTFGCLYPVKGGGLFQSSHINNLLIQIEKLMSVKLLIFNKILSN